eukprot:scaffold11930_cov80-Phaeocystis_antarctica.AAC.3
MSCTCRRRIACLRGRTPWRFAEKGRGWPPRRSHQGNQTDGCHAMQHAAPPVKTSTRCRCSRTDPAVRRQTRGGLQRRRWRCRLQHKRWYSSQGVVRSQYSRRRGILHTRCPPARCVVRRPSAAPCELSRAAAAVVGPSRQPPLATPQMQRHRRALRLAQMRPSPHPPRQTASTEQLVRVRRRRPPQQPAPTAQESSCRRFPASDPHNHSRQVPAVVRAGLLRAERKARCGRWVRKDRRGREPARRQPVVQPIDELHHVNRVEAKLHEACLHRRVSVARAVAQPVHHLSHHQLHAFQAERAARRRLPLRRLVVHRAAQAVLDQHAVPLVRRVLRSVPGHQPAHPRSCVQVEAQPAVAPLLHVVCVRHLALSRPLAATRHAAHALHTRQLRLTQHKRSQHTAQAARTLARHHTQELRRRPTRRVQRRLRPPHRLAQHLDGPSEWKSAELGRLQSAAAASLWYW